MDKFASAKRVVMTPMQARLEVKYHPDFIPIHEYPFGYEFNHGEIGMIAKKEGDVIIEVEKRVIVRVKDA